MEKVLHALRSNKEAVEIIGGAEWGIVYLDNAQLATVSAHQFAGYLSALKKEGLYLPYSGDPCFGLVKLSD